MAHRRNRFTVVALAVSVLCAAAAAGVDTKDDVHMPRRLVGVDERQFHFLAASEVFDDQGALRRDAPLTKDALLNLTDFLNQPGARGDCIHVGEVYNDYINTPRRGDLRTALTTTDFVVEAIAAERTNGFFDGVPVSSFG
jgi:hypothetical protein